MRSIVIVEPRPKETHAVAALALDLVALLRQRQAVDLDDVVEHAREHLDDLAERSQSKRASSVNGSTTNRVRLTEPSRQEPYGGSGCSPQGLVARMFSQNQLLFISLTLSISTKPGSAKS